MSMGALRVGIAVAAAALLASCTGQEPEPGVSPSPGTTTATERSSPSPSPAPEFGVARVLADIRYLASEIGPRHGTSDAYREAADWVEQRFTELGYTVTRQQVDVPAGTSWGVRVPAGRTPNIIASPPGFDDSADHRIVGAHLDTVPQAPGAEDNASGVAVMLELARVHADSERPVRFIAFTAEEPRGAGDNRHHYGSRAYVNRLDGQQREAMRAMVSLDRVGVRGRAVPLCTGGLGTLGVRGQLAAAARDVNVSTNLCNDNRASDHWSFERNDLRAARLGSIPYAAYHSARDLPAVVDRRQLERVGTIMTAWLQPGG
jgi:Zn-dependent M28 family amino/carboxypeptidase